MAAHSQDDKPWALFLSFVCPHPPYIAPPALVDLYPPDDLPMPPQWRAGEWPDHPALAHFRRFFAYDTPFEEHELRRLAAAYYGACTYLDRQIGRVLDALEAQGLAESTRVIYASDHGEALGARGMVGKFDLYDESAGVPLIVAGPDVPAGRVVETPVSLVDLYPTVLEAVGLERNVEERVFPGQSLWQIAAAPDQGAPSVEYHAFASQHGMFMLRNRRCKHIYYVNDRPQLFDLIADPGAVTWRAKTHTAVRAFEREMRSMLDPELSTHRPADQAAWRRTAPQPSSAGGFEIAYARRRPCLRALCLIGEAVKFRRLMLTSRTPAGTCRKCCPGSPAGWDRSAPPANRRSGLRHAEQTGERWPQQHDAHRDGAAPAGRRTCR